MGRGLAPICFSAAYYDTGNCRNNLDRRACNRINTAHIWAKGDRFYQEYTSTPRKHYEWFESLSKQTMTAESTAVHEPATILRGGWQYAK